MRNKGFEKKLRDEAIKDRKITLAWLTEAEKAKARGDMKMYFIRRDVGPLGDYYWILGELDQAKLWYCFVAENRIQAHEYFPSHPDDYPISGFLDSSAEIRIKAGLVPEGRDFLLRAYCVQTDSRQISIGTMRTIGLLAAQIGERQLVPNITYHIDNQVGVFSRSPDNKRTVARLFHQETWAQAHFLLQDYEACRADLKLVLTAEEMIERERINLYSPLLRRMVFDMVHGLGIVIDMLEGKGDLKKLFEEADAYLERALTTCYRFEFLDHQTYLLRLYMLMAQDVLDGRPPNPNPFATS